MPLPPVIPAEGEIVWTTKKIHLGPNTSYDDDKAGVHIKTGAGGEFDGKVSDVDIKLKTMPSQPVNKLLGKAAKGKIASPGIEVAMEVPRELVEKRPTRIVLSVSSKKDGNNLPVTSYGSKAGFAYVAGKKTTAHALAEPREGCTWIGFQINNIDYARFLKKHKVSDVYFTIAAELINAGHDSFGTKFRGALALLDGESGEPLMAYTSKVLQISPKGWIVST